MKDVCLAIENRYEIGFHEIGADEDHIYFLIQSVPDLAPSRIAVSRGRRACLVSAN